MNWPTGRQAEYTEIGIRRLKCIRCGDKARFQWSICADGNVHRPICTDCDIELNRLVLEWAGDPQVESKIAAYKARVE